MKKCILLILISICSTLNSHTQQLHSLSPEHLNINIDKSELKWSCDYMFYVGGHFGDVKFEEGYFIKNNEKITGGHFIIDMHTLKSTDLESAEGNKNLTEHLKNKDFFEVEKFPTAELIIDKTKYHDNSSLKIWAYLTIKDITIPINFQAEINYEKKHMITKFKIDRTLWNINYKSQGLLGSLKENAISDAIEFEVKLNL